MAIRVLDLVAEVVEFGDGVDDPAAEEDEGCGDTTAIAVFGHLLGLTPLS